jgi:hypothetical protein
VPRLVLGYFQWRYSRHPLEYNVLDLICNNNIIRGNLIGQPCLLARFFLCAPPISIFIFHKLLRLPFGWVYFYIICGVCLITVLWVVPKYGLFCRKLLNPTFVSSTA